MTTIRVGKYDMRGRLLAETQVQTLAAAHAFLDALDSNGNTTAAPAPVSIPAASDYTSRESVDAVVRKLTDWNWLAEVANNGWNLPPHGTDALVMLTGRAAAMLDALAKERDAAWASANAYKIDLANSRLREAKATPLHAPMSQGGRIVYDPNHKE